MDATITFTAATVKELMAHLRVAWHEDNQPLLKQLSALLMLADKLPVFMIAIVLQIMILEGGEKRGGMPCGRLAFAKTRVNTGGTP